MADFPKLMKKKTVIATKGMKKTKQAKLQWAGAVQH